MKGSGNALLTLLVLAVLFMGAYLVFTVPRSQVVQQAAPTVVNSSNMKEFPVWNVLVSLEDMKGYPVYDANVYLLFKKPADIYKTPTDYIYMKEENVSQVAEFQNVLTGKEYYVFVEANGYYNAVKEFNMPSKFDKDSTPTTDPVLVSVKLAKKGTILGVQVPLQYRGSTADKAKLVYNSDNDDYKTQFQFVTDTEGVVRFRKIVLDLNTTALGSATIDSMTVKVGDKVFKFSDVTDTKTISFDNVQEISAGSTLPIEITVSGTGLDSVSGQLFNVTLYDVQSGEWTAVVEGPA